MEATAAAAAGTTAAAGLAAGSPIGTANAFYAFFLSSEHVPNHKADDDHEHSNDQNTCHKVTTFYQVHTQP